MRKPNENAPANVGKMFGLATDDVLKDALKNAKTKFAEFEDANGFTRKSTNFYVKDGESVEIAFLSEQPFMVKEHGLKATFKNKQGKLVSFYPDETCQKIVQKHCVLCDAEKTNDSIREAYVNYYYPIVCFDGARDKDGEFSGEPVILFFKANSFMIDRILDKKQEFGDDFTQIVFKLAKVGKNMELAPKMSGKGLKKEVATHDFTARIEPDFGTIFQAKTDSQLIAQYLKDWDGGDTDEEDEPKNVKKK